MEHERPKNPRRATPQEVARHLSVDPKTVFNWFRDGVIPAKVAVGRIYRFDLAEVDEALGRVSQHKFEHSAAGGADASSDFRS